jgi:hypothetical protein
MTSKRATFTEILDFLDKLDAVSIYYEIRNPTPRAIQIDIDVPGEHWEVEFQEDGEVGVDVFRSQGVKGPELLKDLFERFSD